MSLDTTSDRARANMLAELVLTEPQIYTNTDLMRLVIEDVGQTLITVVPEWTPARQYLDYWLIVRDS
jgi:hypothetical protein